MTQTKWMIGVLLALALGLMVYTFVSPTKPDVSEAKAEKKSALKVKRESGQQGSVEPGNGGAEAKSAAKRKAAPKETVKEVVERSQTERAAAKEERKSDPAKKAAAEKAVQEWETLVDDLAEAKDAPTKERQEKVKEAFDKLEEADQMDAIHRSLNLLPDEQFTSLFGILYDKHENPEILDAIFSDALNRPEDIKVPMMKDFLFDKTHPCFFESARILDVTGELDKMAGTDDESKTGEGEGETMEENAGAGQATP